jgi:hypothetical protein
VVFRRGESQRVSDTGQNSVASINPDRSRETPVTSEAMNTWGWRCTVDGNAIIRIYVPFSGQLPSYRTIRELDGYLRR